VLSHEQAEAFQAAANEKGLTSAKELVHKHNTKGGDVSMPLSLETMTGVVCDSTTEQENELLQTAAGTSLTAPTSKLLQNQLDLDDVGAMLHNKAFKNIWLDAESSDHRKQIQQHGLSADISAAVGHGCSLRDALQALKVRLNQPSLKKLSLKSYLQLFPEFYQIEEKSNDDGKRDDYISLISVLPDALGEVGGGDTLNKMASAKPSQEPTGLNSKEQDFVESQLKDQEDQQHFFNVEAQAVAVFFRAEEIEDGLRLKAKDKPAPAPTPVPVPPPKIEKTHQSSKVAVSEPYQDTVAQNTQTMLLEYGTLLASQFHTEYKERHHEHIAFGKMGCKNLTEALQLSQLQSVCFVTDQGTSRMRLWELQKFKRGARLYPLVLKIGRKSKPEIIEKGLVGKITGMLLELENGELDGLIDPHGGKYGILESKIAEAEDVIGYYTEAEEHPSLDVGTSTGSSLNPTAPSFSENLFSVKRRKKKQICGEGDECKREGCRLFHPGRDSKLCLSTPGGLEQLAETFAKSVEQTERLRGASHLRLSYETAVVDESRTISQLRIEGQLVANIKEVGSSCAVVAVSGGGGGGENSEEEKEEDRRGGEAKVSNVKAGGGEGGAGEQKAEAEAEEETMRLIRWGQLEKKGFQRKNWAFRHFELHKAEAGLQVSYFDCTEPENADNRTLKGRGIVSDVKDVPDRNWPKRKHRFNIVLSSHNRRECPCSIEVAAETREQKKEWWTVISQWLQVEAEAKAASEHERFMEERRRLEVEADAAEAEERQVKEVAAEEQLKANEKASQKHKAAAEKAAAQEAAEVKRATEELKAATASAAVAEAKAEVDAQRAAAILAERMAAEALAKAAAEDRSKVEVGRAAAEAKAAAQREAAEEKGHVAQAKAKAEAERAVAEVAAAKVEEDNRLAAKAVAAAVNIQLQELWEIFEPVRFEFVLDRLDKAYCSGTRNWVFDQVKEWKTQPSATRPRVFVCLGLPGLSVARARARVCALMPPLLCAGMGKSGISAQLVRGPKLEDGSRDPDLEKCM
jgi:hypothetical protein